MDPRRDHHSRLRAGHGQRKSRLHDGSTLRLAKLHPEYDPHDRIAAMTYISNARRPAKVVHGPSSTWIRRPRDMHAAHQHGGLCRSIA